MVPRFSSQDPIISGAFREWGGWIWFVWEFQGGWCEWVPAYSMLTTLQIAATPSINHVQLDMVVRGSLVTLHEHFYGREFTENHFSQRDEDQMWRYISEQVSYTGLGKSSWYYSSIPALSDPAANLNTMGILPNPPHQRSNGWLITPSDYKWMWGGEDAHDTKYVSCVFAWFI